MPELPEVETIARQLAPLIRGRRIAAIEIIDEKLRALDAARLRGCHIDDVRRLGKQVLIALRTPRSKSANRWLAVHLRMTGRLIFFPSATDYAHARVILRFTDRSALLFQDTRRFGVLTLSDSLAELQPLGLDPLSSACTPAVLGQLLAGGRQEIKSWLLRQDKLVGIGNIYAAEILHAARLAPQRRASSLRQDEVKLLLQSMQRILKKAVKNCGTTFSDFQDARGQQGKHQHCLAVYGKQGRPCPSCGETIIRLVQGGRSTCYCPRCQN